MRPVCKPAGGDYQQPGSLDLARSPAAASIQAVFATTDPPLADCLQLWCDAETGVATDPDSRAAVQAIRKAVDRVYRKAAVPLLSALGPFCSYCEAPLYQQVEVEHAVPKSRYPIFATEWTNFLLACGPCNQAKSDEPDRHTVNSWGTIPATESDFYDEIRLHHYRWPDLEPDTYTALVPHLYFIDESGQWAAAAEADAVDQGNSTARIDWSARSVTATLTTPAGPRVTQVEVRIDGDNSSRSDAMIHLCALNSTGSAYDRRLLNRTKSWFDAVQAAHALLAGTPSQIVEIAAEAAGFFSVWVRVFELTGAGASALARSPRYPGTECSRLP